MSRSQQERVDNALQSLLERLVPPQQPGEDEESADQRWEDAHQVATRLIDRGENEPLPVDDVNQAADLIRRKLVREGGAVQATAFGNLYSRLLTQPVLNNKWAILYFLLRVGEDNGLGRSTNRNGHGLPEVTTPRAQQSEEDGEENDEQEDEAAERREVFNDAFARHGLPRQPRAQDPEQSDRQSTIRDRERPVPSRPSTQEQANGTPQPSSPVMTLAGSLQPSESALLRDLPFTLQGLSSTNLPFADKKSLRLPTTLPVPLIALLHQLAEPSLLYRSLSDFVESNEGGLVGQSLRSAIGQELRSYLSLVATLEGQIRRALAQLDDAKPDGGLGKAGVTLKRCLVWTREATLGLRLMSMMVESAKGKKGGELISLIHTFSSQHGDPFVHTFAERLLTQVTRPFYHMLRAWIYDGELEDPYQEYFVVENPDEEGGATSVWEQKYRLQEAMIPTIMSSEFANRVYLIGKSLNFIRYACGDSAWVESYSKSASKELKYGDTATLSASIDEAYKTVMARLMTLLETKFALSTHLKAMKKYLLLGQGDFIALLMESLSQNLDRPANSQYRHTLTAQLEHAIRNSNAQYDNADVLRRLDARMLELSHGEIGWDVFTLEYRVDAPLDVIVSPWAGRQYLKVFNFLWRVKRVEFALSTTWRRLQTGARGVLAAVSDKLGADWKSARGRLAEMIHFIDQLQYYVLFEVIEKGWADLQSNMQKSDATLDTLINAHTEYLRNITRKGLLGASGMVGLDFTTQLHELFKLMLAYRDALDSLYSYSVAEFTRRQDVAAKIETRSRAGRWGITEADEESAPSPLYPTASKNTRDRLRERETDSPIPPLLPLQGGMDGERNMLDQLRQRLKSLEVDFKAKVNILLGDLAYQPDSDMRFLAIAMNFNEVYAPVRRGRRKPAEKEKAQTLRTAGPATDRPGRGSVNDSKA
ncbi:Putative gamma-tubulin complex component protein [Septoria linicola]|uniref:Gamma-tubulin complex component protein n=1 Tax=Septoria linicola TaxID=215465 RepID=A0A9Q9ARC4_9PEZI|nr:Putative gamma-tubulin complex component protein [Septoria linicola]